MRPFLRKLYRQAYRDETFNEEMIAVQGARHSKPVQIADDLLKERFAIMYFGWLVGKGTINIEDYDQNT